jgi:hypothetical protein
MVNHICLDGKEIAKNIKEECKRSGRTIKWVFREAKVAYRTYCSWQQGENNPSFATLKRVYAVLNRGKKAK